jgi:hypothetical protein
MRLSRVILISLATFAATDTAGAQASSLLQLHGFANWGGGHSTGGSYEYGAKRGYLDAGTFALAFSAAPSSNVSLVGQLGFNGLGEDVTEPKLDILFAQYTISDALKLNIGRVKQPFGLYTEVFDVGTAHSMLALPHGIYDAAGMMGEVYNGVGFTGGVFEASGKWGLRYDGYAGDVTIATRRPWRPDPEEHAHLYHDVVGGRAVVETPVPGLALGVSAFTGHLFDTTDVESGEPHRVVAAQGEWIYRHFGLRGEVAAHEDADDDREIAAYVEGTLRLSPSLQVAGRFDRSHVSGEDAIGSPTPLLRHTDLSGGVNWWVAPSFVIRAEYHSVVGNRFISPLSPSQLGRRTNIVQFGSQFSF